MMRRSRILLLFAAIFLLTNITAHAGKIRKRKIRKLFKHSLIVKDHFTGFALYDMDAKKMVYELNSDKYFTPASNTKLFTFYTCLKMLGDSIPAFKYITHWYFGGQAILPFCIPIWKVWRVLIFLNAQIKNYSFHPGNIKMISSETVGPGTIIMTITRPR